MVWTVSVASPEPGNFRSNLGMLWLSQAKLGMFRLCARLKIASLPRKFSQETALAWVSKPNYMSKPRPGKSFLLSVLNSVESRVDLHTPKLVIIQFHTSSVWKNACHTIFIQFRKICLILIKQSGDKKTEVLVFWKKKCLSYNSHIWILYDWHFFDGDTKIFSSNFENLAKKTLFFFSTANWNSYANKHFSEKNFLHAKFNFCVHNVVLVTIILAFIFVWLTFFLKNAKNFYFLCMGC